VRFHFFPSPLSPSHKPLPADLHGVQRRFKLNNVVFRNAVETASFSRETGLWTLTVRDDITGTVRTRTCNILISCLGGLTIPNDPPFETKDFNGVVFHSAKWRKDVDFKGKNVVVVGNGSSSSPSFSACAELRSVSSQAAVRCKSCPNS
jgi:cation diffusion facilitator CzcD-associated flavoprotein CzcO